MVETLLTRRPFAALLLTAAVAHLAASQAGPGLAPPCPLHAATGLPCPGCGLSRAGMHLAQGRFSLMWQLHPFAPYFAVLGLMLAGAAALPARLRDDWAARWIALERRTRLHAVALTAFVLYGVGRLFWTAVRPW